MPAVTDFASSDFHAMSEEDRLRLRQERRAKMLELQRSLDPSLSDDVRTSAPSVRQVHQWQQEFGAADRRKQTPPVDGAGGSKGQKHLVYGGGVKKNEDVPKSISTLEENSLLEEAKARERHREAELDQEIDSLFGGNDDDDGHGSLSSSSSVRFHEGHVYESMRDVQNRDGRRMTGSSTPPAYSNHVYNMAEKEDSDFGHPRHVRPAADERLNRSQIVASDKGRSGALAAGLRKSKSFDGRNGGLVALAAAEAKARGGRGGYERQASHTTKIYEDGNYVDVVLVDDQGYGSAASPQGTTSTSKSTFESAATDPLSQSLQDGGKLLRKNSSNNLDLTASLKSMDSNPQRTKCVYDTRMFSNDYRSKNADVVPDAVGEGQRNHPSEVRSGSKSLGNDCKTEEEYFNKMKSFHGQSKPAENKVKATATTPAVKRKESFKEFLSSSFNKTFSRDSGSWKPSKVSVADPGGHNRVPASSSIHMEPSHRDPPGPPPQQQVPLPPPPVPRPRMSKDAPQHHPAHIEEEDPRLPPSTPIDCIDLSYQQETRTYHHQRPRTPSSRSVVTESEFGEPNRRGKARLKATAGKARNMLSSSFNGLLIMIPGLGGMVNGSGPAPGVEVNGRLPRWSGQRNSVSSYYDEEEEREKRKKRRCGGSLCMLLAIDIFTILLLLVLFSHLNDRPFCPVHEIEGRGRSYGRDLYDPYPEAGRRTFNLSISNGTEGPVAKTLNATAAAGQDEIGNGTEEEGTPGNNVNATESDEDATDVFNGTDEGDIQAVVKDMRQQIESLQNELEALKRPPAFSCHKTSSHWREGTVRPYDKCNVRTEDIDKDQGIFTVRVPGIYRLSFTGLFNSQNGHAVSADIIRRRSGGVIYDFLGRSSAKTEENGGGHDDLIATTTLIVMERLYYGDQIYVKLLIDSGHKASGIQSTQNKAIHFTGHRFSD